MKQYQIQSENSLENGFPFLTSTTLLVSEELDLASVINIITEYLLPKDFSKVETYVKLSLVTVALFKDIANWDLIFTYPKGTNPTRFFNYIFDQTILLDDSFEHFQGGDDGIYKISFKVG